MSLPLPFEIVPSIKKIAMNIGLKNFIFSFFGKLLLRKALHIVFFFYYQKKMILDNNFGNPIFTALGKSLMSTHLFCCCLNFRLLVNFCFACNLQINLQYLISQGIAGAKRLKLFSASIHRHPTDKAFETSLREESHTRGRSSWLSSRCRSSELWHLHQLSLARCTRGSWPSIGIFTHEVLISLDVALNSSCT